MFLDDALIRWIHLLAAATWVGGMAFLLFVALPTFSPRDGMQRVSFITHTFSRFLKIIWVSVGLLILSGIGNLYIRLHSGVFVAPYPIYYFGAFFIKFILVLGMISMAGKLHFAIVPRLRDIEGSAKKLALQEPTEEFLQLQKKAMRLIQGTLLAGIIIFLLAAYLTSLAAGQRAESEGLRNSELWRGDKSGKEVLYCGRSKSPVAPYYSCS